MECSVVCCFHLNDVYFGSKHESLFITLPSSSLHLSSVDHNHFISVVASNLWYVPFGFTIYHNQTSESVIVSNPKYHIKIGITFMRALYCFLVIHCLDV
jgi:hypothetical protein